MKFLLVLLVVGVGLWMLTARLRRPGGDDAAGKGGRPRKPADGKPVDMVSCAHCGLHLAATDALTEGAQRYCSDAHRRLGPAPNPPR